MVLMPSPSPADFRLYHANALDVLAELLAIELRKPVPDRPLLEPDIVLIPQAAMRRWLQATLAARHGVAANIEFLAPGEFVARVLDANLGTTKDDLDATGLHWRLYAALTDPALRALPAMAPFDAHMGRDDPLRPWALAGELAATFEKYQAWRRDWLLRWEAGAEPDDPQAILWRAIASGRMHRARRIQRYLDAFEAPQRPLPSGMPARLFAFAILNVSPDVLRVIATQARVGTLHFHVPTPTTEYWGDLQPRAADDDENPLLRDWGAAGRDFLALLRNHDIVRPAVEIDTRYEPLDPTTRNPAQGVLGDSLLRRMQHDLFHRRPPPRDPRDRLPHVRSDDPSLQFHACHTRLRELEVLHDRVRALLEDPRFDPPLQPREIAVLAPDIDPYVPYLDAVFGGRGDADPIPYALADASPLAGEPLADVFLRLLALPLSRFGLEETLDLLASPPIADAAGLDADAFERLRGWLHAAGARWGVDGAHRERSGAPRDDAYTWRFALDRLLLGHASGSDEAIGEVVPWPDLEGSALDALDALLGVLRVLAHCERTFREPAPPAQWRERLLGLLDRLMPTPPAAAATQRALERLRNRIDAFAKDARDAAFDAPVPVEVVRAHFAAELGEADTRAPLLTGGVSFARMVPMRLLPFRVICLLGLNDGDFPRRDPTAGINRLAIEIAAGRRLPGDRSTRDDDRYLFLQLFAAAQDAFLVSWIGADPRDGSVREPSTLVTELLASASLQHADPAVARETLVLRHPLHPFAPSAFGGGESPDSRAFSYRGHWHPAAGRLAGEREPLAPWLPVGARLAREPDTHVTLEALRGFLLRPAETFLRGRLDLRLPEADAGLDDIEPLQGPESGLDRHTLDHAVFDALVADRADGLDRRLRACGLLPSGAPGRRVLADVMERVAPYAEAFSQWRAGADAGSMRREVAIDGVILGARIEHVFGHGIARVRIGKPNGPSAIRDGLDWLFSRAAGIDVPFVEFHDGGTQGVGPHERPPLDPEQARRVLAALLALREEGLQRPLPFAPYSAWELFTAADPHKGIRAAAAKWRGGEAWSEGASAASRIALRARDPFADSAAIAEFARITGIVFGAVTRGAPAPIDIADVAVPGTDDAEDEA